MNYVPTLTECQMKALKLLNGDANVFLTGVAGSGKSFLIQHYLTGRDRKSHVVVASTGTAAVLAGGVTFHSFFGLGIMEGGLERTIEKARKNKRLKSRLKKVAVVLIDEVSMIPGVAFNAAERICRELRGKNLPWGGIQIIAIGDFGQLPPVNVHGSKKDWAFQSDAWQASEFKIAYLKTIMRSHDTELLEVLNAIRDGKVSDQVTRFLNARTFESDMNFSGTRLFPHRHSVDQVNLHHLSELPGEVMIFPTDYMGEDRFIEQLKRSAPVPETLCLKTGALIMIRKNDPKQRFVNGSLATVKSIKAGELEVELLNGFIMTLQPETFTYLDADGEEVAAAVNFPVNLAWATTIHKAQGMTLDRAQMDLSRVFEAGQAYVALSRVKSSEGLYLTGWNARAIRAAPEVQEFHSKLLADLNN